MSSPRPWQAPAIDPSIAAPPGLSRGAEVAVESIPTDRGRLYAYRDRGGREIICGVAAYGVDPGPLAERLIGPVKSSPTNLQEDLNPRYSLAGARPARVHYFGSPMAPGLQGALIIERPVDSEAPSLEADFHVILVP